MKAASGPRRLPHILQAIEDLGDIRGSSTKRIVDQVESTHYGGSERPKNLTTDVRKALKYAVDNGIVRERAGKFTVASFYGTKKSVDPSKSIFECRRRRKKAGNKRRRRRHRRHASLSSLSDSEVSLSGDEWESDRDRSNSRSRSRSPQYTTAGIISHRRRRGKHGHSHHRRRRRRGRKHAMNAVESSPKVHFQPNHRMQTLINELIRSQKFCETDDGRCVAHHLQDCDSPGCRGYDKEVDEDQRGSYIN